MKELNLRPAFDLLGIYRNQNNNQEYLMNTSYSLERIAKFHNGTDCKEKLNGATDEIMINLIISRLEEMNQAESKCREYEEAINGLKYSLGALEARTNRIKKQNKVDVIKAD